MSTLSLPTYAWNKQRVATTAASSSGMSTEWN